MADSARADTAALELRPSETWQDRIAAVRREEQADHEAADEMLAQQQAEAEAEADAALAAELAEIADRLQQGEPPADLVVDTAGLPPQRARLLRFGARVDGKRTEMDRLRRARPLLVETTEKPAAAKQRREQIKREDQAALKEWALAKVDGGDDFNEPRPVPRSYEVELIRSRHAEDAHGAEVALEELAETDRTIERLTREIPALEARRDEFVSDAVAEHAGLTLGARYTALIAELAGVARDLNGWRVAAGKPPLTIDHALPAFDVAGVAGHRTDGLVDLNAPRKPLLRVTESASRAAADPWKAIAARLRADPRTDLETIHAHD